MSFFDLPIIWRRRLEHGSLANGDPVGAAKAGFLRAQFDAAHAEPASGRENLGGERTDAQHRSGHGQQADAQQPSAEGQPWEWGSIVMAAKSTEGIGPKGERKVATVMHEWGKGELHSGSKKGPVVKDQRQAVAIALSQARKTSRARGR
jgi:hypothetical protein